MDMDDLPDLLDGPPPGGDDLRAIVGRARSRGRRTMVGVAGGVAVVALAGGTAIGWGVWSGPGKGSGIEVISGAATPAAGTTSGGGGQGRAGTATPPGSGDAAGGGTSGTGPSIAVTEPTPPAPLKKVFVRQANGITVRGFTTNVASYTGCSLPVESRNLEAEISSQGMVGTVYGGPTASSGLVDEVHVYEVGQAEGSPAWVVVVGTEPGVANVKVNFTGGAVDQMAPVDGWSVLVAPASGQGASVGGLDATGPSGASVALIPLTTSTAVPVTPPFAQPACVCNLPVAVPGATSSGGAGSSSGATRPKLLPSRCPTPTPTPQSPAPGSTGANTNG